MKIKRFHLIRGKKPYVRKVDEIGDKEIWLVDDEYVRKNICEDFLYKGQHYRFNFIPKNEFWISKDVWKKEGKFYTDYLLIENRLMKKNLGKKEAEKRALSYERKERKRSKKIRKFKKIKDQKKIIEKVHKKIFLKNKNLKVWVVSGELVRDIFDIDFAGGGHDKVYHYIPPKEVWIDDDILQNERKYILLHELHERFYMTKGMKYLPAHRRATKVEDYARHHPKTIDKALRTELKRQR